MQMIADTDRCQMQMIADTDTLLYSKHKCVRIVVILEY
jgi:hypothetical protein